MWWSGDEWEALLDPGQCGMCRDAHLAENEHSVLIVSTPTSHLRLARNQAHAGYCLVILREHVTDMGRLPSEQLHAFWTDVQRAGRAVESVYAPRKIDYLVMGHRMPHLHCHVFPQHHQDDPKRNVDISDGPVTLAPGELKDAVHALGRAWSTTATGATVRSGGYIPPRAEQ
ncbi:HIT domain-containing protein [Microbacterium algeriense]|uniref:HIT domain-containing protein n=2 Tax=Microbacterium algeriense TaxID=2615184 RepID=A0ABQ6V7I7_9MICO|nr:HIT domain-containing protein [Microbacterium algeriense]